MFSWTFDPETNGILLTPDRQTKRNSEVSPVWHEELQAFIGDKIRIPESEAPIGWYYRGGYYHRGQKFARRREAEIELLADPGELHPVDIDGMSERNAAMLAELESMSAQTLRHELTTRGIRSFRIAYSAGKDSEALLAFALKNFPEYISAAVFADTTLEFPQTLEHVEATRARLEAWGIDLETAKPYLEALTGWRLFGVPSRSCRWCCQACKSGALAKIADGGEAYLMGARDIESKYRAGYSIDAGRRSLSSAPTFRPLYDWTASEVWLYLFHEHAKINSVYRHGHHRACCIVCPFSSPFEVEISKRMASEQIEPFRQEYLRQFPGHEQNFDRRYKGDAGTWSRVNAQMLAGDFPIREKIEDGIYKFTLPKDESLNIYWINLLKKVYDARTYNQKDNKFIIQYFTKAHTSNNRLLVNMMNRAFYCVGCGYCINYCANNYIKIVEGRLIIDEENCSHCLECVENECIRSKALRGYAGTKKN